MDLMNKVKLNRREFVQTASTAAASGILLQAFGAKAHAAANDIIRIGVIGPGSRGQELIRQFLHLPDAQITAVCDIYEPRFTQVDRLVGKTVPSYRDYRELLARKDLDAIVVSTPVSLHHEHALAALRSGRPVYCEKALGFTPEECQGLVNAVDTSGQILQMGFEYRYAAWIQKSIAEIQAGKIGEPTHVYAYWHRNNDWRRPVPSPGLEHLINWRLYRETSGGLLTELGSHQIDIANWVFGEQPSKVIGTTSIVKYHDGRTVGDNVQAVFNYSKGRRMFFSSLTDNAEVGNQLWIYGTEGSVQFTIEDATFYYEPKKAVAAPAGAEVVQRGITTGASYQTKGEMPYRGAGEKVQVENAEDPTLAGCRAFLHSVRTKEQPIANVHVGFASAIATVIGNRAMYDERSYPIPAMRKA